MNMKLLVIFLFLTPSLFASYVTRAYGEDPILADGSGNPALFLSGPYFMEKKFDVRINEKAYFFGERIMSFDNPVSLYNSYQIFYFESVSVSCRPLPLLAFNLSLLPWKSFDYKSEYHFPAGASVYDGVKTLDITGSVRSLQLSAVCHVKDVFAFGLTGGYLFGSQDIESSASFEATPGLDWQTAEKITYSGWKLDFHAEANPCKSCRIAAFATLPVNLNRVSSPGINDVLLFPPSVGLTASIRTTKPVSVELYVSGLYGFTKDFKVRIAAADFNYTPYGCHDNFAFLCGMKTVLKAGSAMIPFRLGYACQPDFINYFADKNAVFAGCDVPIIQGIGLSLDAEFSKRNWRGDNTFYEVDKLVDETAFTVKLGLTWSR